MRSLFSLEGIREKLKGGGGGSMSTASARFIQCEKNPNRRNSVTERFAMNSRNLCG
ncbi:hypothetical protein T03_17984 [Trichinella britovi]|uniref:Uncharacterized protein n=1 Tax=Trichinella britovi TaxID=45882 RepID=A0A0V0YY46_TRIBR|nr:hypothetical protein T03_17984 [Trichinella britovi]